METTLVLRPSPAALDVAAVSSCRRATTTSAWRAWSAAGARRRLD